MNVFTKPPKLRELGAQADQSYWSVRRMAMAGVIPIVNFPDGQRVDVDWANRYVRSGLTDEELTRYRDEMRRLRSVNPRELEEMRRQSWRSQTIVS